MPSPPTAGTTDRVRVRLGSAPVGQRGAWMPPRLGGWLESLRFWQLNPGWTWGSSHFDPASARAPEGDSPCAGLGQLSQLPADGLPGAAGGENLPPQLSPAPGFPHGGGGGNPAEGEACSVSSPQLTRPWWQGSVCPSPASPSPSWPCCALRRGCWADSDFAA